MSDHAVQLVTFAISSGQEASPARHSVMTKAYVIGASLAGLLAASALTGHFDQVVIMERDELPDRATSRRGCHKDGSYTLMTRALTAFDELLPEHADELT